MSDIEKTLYLWYNKVIELKGWKKYVKKDIIYYFDNNINAKLLLNYFG